ncbi:Uncharacterized protein F383_16360 [Gossypium arboreum]|uniref:Uncharacterized protein n=1 Tax=Gossypium arboreum TaxID=29729 RepID=A0A0B0PY17_GOSAR|nr:Uncharacterized protein F383_16360 [Gossypium arboreum]
MPLGVALEMAKMVWIALSGWVCSCLTIADEVAASLRSGDIGPFHSSNTLVLEEVSCCGFLHNELARKPLLDQVLVEPLELEYRYASLKLLAPIQFSIAKALGRLASVDPGSLIQIGTWRNLKEELGAWGTKRLKPFLISFIGVACKARLLVFLNSSVL